MKSRPTIFSGPMVRAILEGRKTQTRRVIKPQPIEGCNVRYSPIYLGPYVEYDPTPYAVWWPEAEKYHKVKCPYGAPRDLLYVKETWNLINGVDSYFIHYHADDSKIEIEDYNEFHLLNYLTGDDDGRIDEKKRPSIYMPRWASRITLCITDIRIQRIKEINDSDCRNEGIQDDWGGMIGFQEEYRFLWDSINAKRGYSWESNPWVFAITFERIKKEA